MGDIEGLMNLLESENTDDLSQRMATINLVGRWRGSVVDTVEEAEAVQEDATQGPRKRPCRPMQPQDRPLRPAIWPTVC